jgi:transcriptional regulator with XRE-family HTH domain
MTRETRGPALDGLRERRLFRNITQVECAELIGVTQSHYRQFETGNVRLDVHRAKKLADLLECRIEDLL